LKSKGGKCETIRSKAGEERRKIDLIHFDLKEAERKIAEWMKPKPITERSKYAYPVLLILSNHRKGLPRVIIAKATGMKPETYPKGMSACYTNLTRTLIQEGYVKAEIRRTGSQRSMWLTITKKGLEALKQTDKTSYQTGKKQSI